MNDFYQKMAQARGSFSGTTLLQARGEVGGFRHVFVSLAGPKIGVMYPISGGILKNPFKGTAKVYAADLVEYKPNGECYILKTQSQLKYYKFCLSQKLEKKPFLD